VKTLIVLKSALLASALMLVANSAFAIQLEKDGTYKMEDYGRFHGYLRGGLMPKCNPWVSPECARLYPGLFKIVPRPR
jgi:hypothetical protein